MGTEDRSREVPVRADDSQAHGRPVVVFRHDGSETREGPSHRMTHAHAVLAFCTGGSSTVEQQGEWTLQAGDVLLIPWGEPHRHLSPRRPEVWGVGFCPVCLTSGGGEGLLEPFERVRAGASAVVRIPEERRPFLESLIRELRRELEREGEETPGVQRSYLTLILAEVSRATTGSTPAEGGDSVVAEALRFIERHCLEPLSLKDVAAAVHRAPAYLTTAVRRATGRTVQAWIISGRLSEARRRLLHTDEDIDIIAERVGYADATHFIRVFRRSHGLTPAAWRARHRRPPAPSRA